MANKPYVGDIGTIIRINMQEDVSAATVKKFYMMKPGATIVTELTDISVSGQYLSYVVKSGDFSVEGVYEIQPYLEIGGWKGRGETAQFRVYSLYD